MMYACITPLCIMGCKNKTTKKKTLTTERNFRNSAYIGSLSEFRISYYDGINSSLKVQILQLHSQAHVWIQQKNPCEQYVEPSCWCLVLQCYSKVKKDDVTYMKKEEKIQEFLLNQRMARPSVWRSTHEKIILLLHPDPTSPLNPQTICGLVTLLLLHLWADSWRKNWISEGGQNFIHKITMVPLVQQFPSQESDRENSGSRQIEPNGLMS